MESRGDAPWVSRKKLGTMGTHPLGATHGPFPWQLPHGMVPMAASTMGFPEEIGHHGNSPPLGLPMGHSHGNCPMGWFPWQLAPWGWFPWLSNFFRETHGHFFMGFPWDISVRGSKEDYHRSQRPHVGLYESDQNLIIMTIQVYSSCYLLLCLLFCYLVISFYG